MCHKLTHTCKYCGREYLCNEKNWVCPTINGDANANMCADCHDRLEKEIEKFGENLDTTFTPEEILGDDNETN